MNTSAPLFLLLMGVSACTGFVPVRSAEVVAGPRLKAGATLAAPPGDDAAWFWTILCESDCNRPVGGVTLNGMIGVTLDSGPSFELGGGISGFYLYGEGFVQLKGGDQPFGIGARASLPAGGSREDVLYVAYDFTTASGTRLVMTSSLFRHGWATRDGNSSGSFMAFAQGVGLLRRTSRTVPFIVVGLGRTRRGRRQIIVTGNGRYRETHASMAPLLVVGLSATLRGRVP